RSAHRPRRVVLLRVRPSSPGRERRVRRAPAGDRGGAARGHRRRCARRRRGRARSPSRPALGGGTRHDPAGDPVRGRGEARARTRRAPRPAGAALSRLLRRGTCGAAPPVARGGGGVTVAEILPPLLRRAVSPYTGVVRSLEECLATTSDPACFRFACEV